MEFQKYVILDSNETGHKSAKMMKKFQKYVILDSNETSPAEFTAYVAFQKYVILDSNETWILNKMLSHSVLEVCYFRQ